MVTRLEHKLARLVPCSSAWLFSPQTSHLGWDICSVYPVSRTLQFATPARIHSSRSTSSRRSLAVLAHCSMLWVSAENSGDIASQRFSFWRAATSAARMSLVLASLGALVTMQKSLLSSTNQCLIPVGRSEAVRDLASGFVHNFERRREGFSRGSCGGWWGEGGHGAAQSGYRQDSGGQRRSRGPHGELDNLHARHVCGDSIAQRNMNPLVHTPSAFDLAPRARVRNKFV